MDENKREEEPEDWTVNDVRRWFESDRDWHRYADTMWEEAIDGRELCEMTITKLADIGIKKNDRPDLLREIRSLFAGSRTPGRLKDYSSLEDDDMDDDASERFDFPCYFEVLGENIKVRESVALDSPMVGRLKWSTKLRVVEQRGRRMRIVEPMRGWVSYKTKNSGQQMLSKITYGGNSDSESDWGDGGQTIQSIADKRRDRRKLVENVKRRVGSLRRLNSSRNCRDTRDDYSDEEVRNIKDANQVFKAQSKMSEDELTSLNYKLDIATSEVNELKNQILDKDEEVNQLREQLRNRALNDREYDERRADLDEAQGERDDLIEAKHVSQEKVRNLEEKVDKLNEQLDAYKEKLKQERTAGFSRTRRYSDEDTNDRPRRYSNERRSRSPPRSKPARRARASSLDAMPRKRRYSSDDFDAEKGRSTRKGGSPRREVYQSNYKDRADPDPYDEEFEEGDRYDTPSKMKTQSDPDFDEDWSLSKRNTSPAPRQTCSHLTSAERRARRIGKEDFAWFVHYDSKGKPYFYNAVTDSDRKDKPGCLYSDSRLQNADPVILCEYDGIWYKAQLLEPHKKEFWWVRFDCGNVKRASIHRDHIRKWVAWLEQTDEY